MAEILLSLTIIGVVAAITLPSLTGNINERTWNTQRKALYARFSQAIALMPSLNGYGKYSGTNTDGVVTVSEDTAAETFVTDGLAKVLKINNICDAEHLADCGIVSSYTNIAGSRTAWATKLSELNSMFTGTFTYSNTPDNKYENPQKDIDTKAAAFETANGESITVYYNPRCVTISPPTINSRGESNLVYSQTLMCANFIYDLNGNKGPNTVGKDIGFITALYPSDSVVVAPMPLTKNITVSNHQEVSGACVKMDSESRAPNKEELSAMFYNKELVDLSRGRMWTGSVYSPTLAWYIDFDAGDLYLHHRTGSGVIRCIKR